MNILPEDELNATSQLTVEELQRQIISLREAHSSEIERLHLEQRSAVAQKKLELEEAYSQMAKKEASQVENTLRAQNEELLRENELLESKYQQLHARVSEAEAFASDASRTD